MPERERRAPCHSARPLSKAARMSLADPQPAEFRTGGAPGAPFAKTLWRANWFAEDAVFLLARA